MALNRDARQQVAPEGGVSMGRGASEVDEYGDFGGPRPQTGIDLEKVCPCSLAGHYCQHPTGQFWLLILDRTLQDLMIYPRVTKSTMSLTKV